ncbi:ABC transporter ATP-binding protein [Aliidiomarina indica]|uniref:ABC transporter ATP-binding protein n=1 Tax=Aliidiomarina indica TaxID=2749147 RepID=UPI001890947F|nr:ABC transporter ATP-binding protein [Aliidiomarina indica]
MTDFSVSVRDLAYTWRGQSKPTLNIDTLTIQHGERIILRGPSGSGKSTLLSLLAGVHDVQDGELHVLGKSLKTMSQSQRDRYRADHMGYIFQQFNLLPFLTVQQNVLLAVEFSRARRERLEKAGVNASQESERLLTSLGIHNQLWHKPASELSVGQQQRVAAARALIGAPEILIADEPTSALDADARDNFLALLKEECGRHNITLIFVTHDASLASHFDRIIELQSINKVALEVHS